MEPRFIHLHLHTEYSLVDSVVRIKALVPALAEQNMPAVAVTDQFNLFSLVKFYRVTTGAGIKPVIGVDVWIRNPEQINQPYRLLLLAQNNHGYGNLRELVSRGYQHGQHLGRPMLDRDWLNADSCKGLIALSGARDGDVGRALLAGNESLANALLDHWLGLFPDRYYLQLVRTGRPNEEACLHACVAIAEQRQLPVVATNEVCFLKPEDFDAHEVRVCINQSRTLDDPRRSRDYSPQQYLRSAEEMAELFSDVPEALENSVEIARRCNVSMTFGKDYLPDFPIPDDLTMDEFFRQLSRKGLEERLHKILDMDAEEFAEKRKPYDERLEIELEVIIGMGFPGYFLIVADFIQWAKDENIPVGPGRGSGAGSLVAYALKITDLDPLEHELLFERFLNPERISMPDFDIDFCMDRRDEVIDYVADRYGRDAVSQIITYGTMAAKAVTRDVGRVLGHPYGFTDRVAKMIPFDLGITLSKALEESEELKQTYESDEEVRQLIDMALQLEGLTRNAGKHAGGVVIAPGKLTDFTALYCEADGSNLVTQFDKNDVEAVGLVKFDFLGLRTLTIIDWALKTINRQHKIQGKELVDINAIPMDDPESFALLKTGNTTAVFQLESSGMQELIRKLQPDCFDEITALVALYRPGPLGTGMVDDFIACKHGHQEAKYLHPSLETILKPTYGVILYQEQVMQIAQVLAGYSLGGADLLRRAMGKKKPEEMEKQGEIFREGSVSRGVDEALATRIFDLMAHFAGYGFNKSHSAAYALVSYQTLWLKTHFPAAFMAAVLSADMDNTDKVVHLIEECREMELDVLPPQVNRSEYQFTVGEERQVVYGLGAIKGVGESAIEGIIEARAEKGEFRDLFDFCQRIDLRKCNRRVLESLIRAGALDELGSNRATLLVQLPLALKMAEQHHALQAAGQSDLFGMSEPEAPPAMGIIPDDVPDWSDEQRLRGEKETLGLFLTGHPIDFYEPELKGQVTRIANLALDENQKGYGRGKEVTVAGLVMSVNKRITQKGSMMATVLLDDKTGRIELTLFSDAYECCRELLIVDKVLVVQGKLVHDEYRGGLGLRAEEVNGFESFREQRLTMLDLVLTEQLIRSNKWTSLDVRNQLLELLSDFKGGEVPVCVRYQRQDVSAMIRLGEKWRVTPRDELLLRLRQLLGENAVQLHYGSNSVNDPVAIGV
jgi:DNA polymerase-3 subunit alpha